MEKPPTKRGRKTPWDWAIFAAAVINLTLATLQAYKDFPNLTQSPLWYIHLIAATLFIAILIMTARSKTRLPQTQAQNPQDHTTPTP